MFSGHKKKENDTKLKFTKPLHINILYLACKTDGPSKLYIGCSLIRGIFTQKNQQSVFINSRENQFPFLALKSSFISKIMFLRYTMRIVFLLNV